MAISLDFLRITLLPLIIVTNMAAPKVVEAKPPTAKSLLWEVSGNGLNQPSYLFGTIHGGCASRLALSAKQKEALNKTKQLYLESAKSTSDVNFGAGIPGGKKLKDLMSASQYKKVEDHFGRYELEEGSLKDYPPFSLALRASKQLDGTGRRVFSKLCENITSKEAILTETARKQKMLVAGIETATDRKNSFSVQDGLEFLIAVISDSRPREVRDKEFLNGELLYGGQDINALFIDSQESGKEYPNFFNAILAGRNRLWLPRMIKIMSQKPTFFAFGADHLGGETGLIPLLESEGYILRPIFDKKDTCPAESIDRTRIKPLMAAEECFDFGNSSEDKLSAYNYYSQAIALNPQYAEAYYARGSIKKDVLDDFKGALLDLDKAIAINPKYTIAYFSRGLLKNYNLSDYKGAKTDLDTYISLSPGVSKAYHERAILKGNRLNDAQGALSDFDTAIYYSYDNQELYLARGTLKYINLNNKLEGIADVRRAIQLAYRKDDNPVLEKANAVLQMMLVKAN